MCGTLREKPQPAGMGGGDGKACTGAGRRGGDGQLLGDRCLALDYVKQFLMAGCGNRC